MADAAVARQLDAKAPAELLDRSLTHRVRDGACPIDIREHRTHHHDLPRLLITIEQPDRV